MKRPLLIFSTLLALSGCAGTYTEPTLPTDHPANASAAEAAPVTMSRTLDLAAADPLTPTPTGAGMEHSGHGRTDTATPKSSVPGMADRAHEKDAPSPSAAPKPEREATAAVVYACPMHPEVTSDKPDQRCPKCGMKLVKQNGGKQP